MVVKIPQFSLPPTVLRYLTVQKIVQMIMGVKSRLLCDEKMCNGRIKSLQVTKMIAIKPTSSRLVLSGMAQKPFHQQITVRNVLILLFLIIILRTSSVLSVQISDVVDIATGDGQTLRGQWSSGSLPRCLSRGKVEEVSLVSEIARSQEPMSLGNHDLKSRRRSPSRLLLMANTARGYEFTESAATVSNSGPDELNALLAIKNSFVDDFSILASWTSNSGNKKNDSSHCRTWVGVTCNSLQQVVGINLTVRINSSNFNTPLLLGTISPAFGLLKHLEVLDLSYNDLDGGIPSELGDLPRLKVLWLMSCNLNGVIPTSLGNCSSLRHLDLDSNMLIGVIPTSLGNCSSLRHLDLNNNKFIGLIPPSLGNCQNLQYLDLSSNILIESNIPSTFEGLKQLQSLILRGVGLTGTIPAYVGHWQNLTYFDVSNNNLNGNIPSSIGDWKQLQTLHLDNNQLTGVIPSTLGDFVQLTDFNLSSNLLSGTIPANVGHWQNLTYFDVSNNNLTGSIPSSIGDWKQLQVLHLNSNHLTGVIPSTLGDCFQLIDFNLSSNLLSGNIPPSLGNLHNLITLQLQVNSLTGPIPTTFGNLVHLQQLWLANNNLTGVIPKALGSLNELTDMDLSTNNFHGDTNAIPSSFCNLANLTTLKLSESYLGGSIPSCLGELGLHILDLSSNKLTGPIPSFSNPRLSNSPLAQFEQPPMQTIILSNNRLSGPIPDEFANLTSINYLDLGGNRLSGTIPNSVLQWPVLEALDLSSNMFTGEFPLVSPNNSCFPPLSYLDISNNNLNNSVSLFLSSLYKTFWAQNLLTLRIGKNFFHGPLAQEFSLFQHLLYFSATNNRITGPLPPSFGSQNSTLVLIDLSHNQLTGDIWSRLDPQVGANNLSALRVLTLANNKLTGPIPMWITSLTSLQVLDLSFNNLTGSIPLDLHSMLGYKDVSSNLGGPDHFSLVQTVNFATQPFSNILLTTTTYMDLSSNVLTGAIPPSIVELSGLLYLYLSNNNLTGNIPTSLGNLSQLEILDLSRNNLTGEIPSNLISLSYLQIFNVSFNNLSGPIPTTGQFVSFSNTSYLPGNNDLCGEVIHRLCNFTSQVLEPHVLKKAVCFKEMISLPGFVIGVGVGFFSVVFFLLHREAWSRFFFKQCEAQ